MLVKDLRQMLAEALRIGHARCVVLFTIERHTDTLSSEWFHGADSPYGAVCSIHSIGREVESSYCLHRFSTNHEIRWNQERFGVFRVQAGAVLQCTVDQDQDLPGQPVASLEGLGKLPGLCFGEMVERGDGHLGMRLQQVGKEGGMQAGKPGR